jgi:hypothetical protein
MVDVNILCCVIVVMELGLGRERGQMHIFLNIVDHLLGALVGKTKPFFWLYKCGRRLCLPPKWT